MKTEEDMYIYVFYRQIFLCYRLGEIFGPVTRHFFAPSLYILYAADFNYLIRWVIVTYIMLDISVVNSHATSAYVALFTERRLDNARSVIRP